MKTVARLAGVSVNRAVGVLNNLVSLGIVERREAGSAALVRLAGDNQAARSIVALAQLFDRVLVRLRERAEERAGTIAEARERVKQLVAQEKPGGVVRRVLGGELGL